MANIINELNEKISIWESDIEHYKREYRDAQEEIMRINSNIAEEANDSDEFSHNAIAALERQKSFEERKMTKAHLGLVKASAEISKGIAQIDDRMSKIEKTANGLIALGSVNKYGKAGMSSSSVKTELQNMKTAILQLSQLRIKLTELGYKCDLTGGESDKPMVKSIWQETNPYKK